MEDLALELGYGVLRGVLARAGRILGSSALRWLERAVAGGTSLSNVAHQAKLAGKLATTTDEQRDYAKVAAVAGALAPREVELVQAIARLPGKTQAPVMAAVIGDVFSQAEEQIQARVDASDSLDRIQVTVTVPRQIDDLIQKKTSLSGYTLKRKVGEGGFGTVYLGENAAQQTAAIKVPHHTGSFKWALHEARLTASLDHPGIVRLRGIDATEPYPHLIFDFVEGETLGSWLKNNGRMPVNALKAMLIQILGALEHAHGRGVVHRDLSPDNLMLTGSRDVQVKVLDFGIGKVSSQVTDTVTRLGSLTETALDGAGKYAYMAPEQKYRNLGTVDGRADLFALAKIAFEACEGVLPDGITELKSAAPEVNEFFAKAFVGDVSSRLKCASDALSILRAPSVAGIRVAQMRATANDEARRVSEARLEEGLLTLFRSVNWNKLQVAPSISVETQKSVQDACLIGGDRLLALLDLTFWGSCADFVCFGTHGLYFRESRTAHPALPRGRIKLYTDLSSCVITRRSSMFGKLPGIYLSDSEFIAAPYSDHGLLLALLTGVQRIVSREV